MTKRLLMGNEACAYAALEAGASVFAGYPGTPSSELIETVARLVADDRAAGVHVEWSTNEKAALEVVAGAALSGARALFTCKQVGLNVASDALLSLNYVGIRGGLVLFVADDPGPISSQTEQDTRRFASFAKVPVFDPATPEQAFAMMKEAFELSERYATPVIVRPTTRIDHASAFFDVAERTDAEAIRQKRRAGDGDGIGFVHDERYVIFPRRSYEAHKEINVRLRAMAHDFASEDALAAFNPAFFRGAGEADAASSEGVAIGIICGGDSTEYALDALDVMQEEAARRDLALPACRIMQIGTPYPFPAEGVRRFLDGLDHVLVLEELDSVIEEELLKLASTSIPVCVHGRLTGEADDAGENSSERALARIAHFFDIYGDCPKAEGAMPEPSFSAEGSSQVGPLQSMADDMMGSMLYRFDGSLPSRPPTLCAGCPHRGSFYAVKKALDMLGIKRQDAVLCGDIGCYTLGNAAPLDAVDTCLCMGAGITMAQGITTVSPGQKAIAFVGDSTFFASGITGIVNAAYNDHDITVCVLDNSTTAMTGMQPHPGIGLTLMGTHSAPLSIPAVLKAAGIEDDAIEVADPLDTAAAVEACARAIGSARPTAVIFKSPCIWLAKSQAQADVNGDICIGCKKCITEIGCPAIGFDQHVIGPKSGARGQAHISASLCTGCGLCVGICPTHSISVHGKSQRVETGAVRGLQKAGDVL